ncbi:hypothetical protein OG558_03320 [Kribbella sp. NBC_01510]|uniref:hypothetical protein n=1 Tax=Kribbella sp. NBC_01510 TaxID=2903581 RepID=UPI00386E270F
MVHELRERAASGVGILLPSHDLELVRALATRLVVSAGQVIASGGPDVLPIAPKLRAGGNHCRRTIVASGNEPVSGPAATAAHTDHPQSPPVLTPDTRSEPRR